MDVRVRVPLHCNILEIWVCTILKEMPLISLCIIHILAKFNGTWTESLAGGRRWKENSATGTVPTEFQQHTTLARLGCIVLHVSSGGRLTHFKACLTPDCSDCQHTL